MFSTAYKESNSAANELNVVCRKPHPESGKESDTGGVIIKTFFGGDSEKVEAAAERYIGIISSSERLVALIPYSEKLATFHHQEIFELMPSFVSLDVFTGIERKTQVTNA